MHKILLIGFLLYTNFGWAQTISGDSIVVTDLNKKERKVKVETFEIINGDTINMLVSINDQKVRYGRWLFFYDNDTLKSIGEFTIRGVSRDCGDVRDPVPVIPHYFECRIGKWNYFTEEGEKRTDLYGDEQPSNGNYKHYDTNGRLLAEGYFAEAGRIENGLQYQYNHATGQLTEVAHFLDGRCYRREKK